MFGVVCGVVFECVGACYQPRWSRHTVVGVAQGVYSGECNIQLLINPELVAMDGLCAECTNGLAEARREVVAIECAILGFGATLLRRPILTVPFRLAEVMGGVEGEDIGFCLDLLATNNSLYRPHFLASHKVHHVSGGKAARPFIPNLSNINQPSSQSGEFAMLTHIRYGQLFWVENDLPIEWRFIWTPRRCPKILSKSEIESRSKSPIDFYGNVPLPLLPHNYHTDYNKAVTQKLQDGKCSVSECCCNYNPSHPLPILLEKVRHSEELPIQPTLQLPDIARSTVVDI